MSNIDSPAMLHKKIAGWRRRGGRRCTVHVTAAEFAQVLAAGLPQEFGPWHVTGTDTVPVPSGRGYTEQAWAFDDVDLAVSGVDTAGRHRTNMWVWSSALTEASPALTLGAAYEDHCSFNGFLLIQHATDPVVHPVSRRAVSKDVCVVDAVYDRKGELVSFPHYLSVWQRVARRLRKIASDPGPPHGHPLWTGHRWSPAALSEGIRDL